YEAHAQLFQVRRAQGRLDAAAEALNRAIERQADKPELFRARATLVARLDEEGHDGAKRLSQWQRAAAIRDLGEAIRLETHEDQKANDQAERGRLLFASGQADEALAAYDAALKVVPGHATALRLRTFALLERKRYDEVLDTCNRALANGNPSADLLEARGLARLDRKDFAGAISDYTVALSLAGESAPLHAHRGWAYLFKDAFRLAVDDFDAALRIDPGLGDAYSG